MTYVSANEKAVSLNLHRYTVVFPEKTVKKIKKSSASAATTGGAAGGEGAGAGADGGAAVAAGAGAGGAPAPAPAAAADDDDDDDDEDAALYRHGWRRGDVGKGAEAWTPAEEENLHRLRVTQELAWEEVASRLGTGRLGTFHCFTSRCILNTNDDSRYSSRF